MTETQIENLICHNERKMTPTLPFLFANFIFVNLEVRRSRFSEVPVVAISSTICCGHEGRVEVGLIRAKRF